MNEQTKKKKQWIYDNTANESLHALVLCINFEDKIQRRKMLMEKK